MYFVWESRRADPKEALITAFAPTASLYGIGFIRGRRFSTQPQELTIELYAYSLGKFTYDLLIVKRRCLVHSAKLIAVLKEAGVDNIDYYPCRLKNTVTGREIRTFRAGENEQPQYYYQAANILDLIHCLDTDESGLEYDDEEPNELWYIHNMKLLEDRIQDVRMFRLGEDSSIVIVDERVKDAVEKSGATGVCFIPADGYRDYQGYAFDNPRNVIGTHDDDPHGPADSEEE
jgi:hypothetical protein